MSTKNSHAGTEMSTLGNVATYINGRAFKPSEWEDSGLPIIRIQNLTNFSAPYNYSSRELEEKYKEAICCLHGRLPLVLTSGREMTHG